MSTLPCFSNPLLLVSRTTITSATPALSYTFPSPLTSLTMSSFSKLFSFLGLKASQTPKVSSSRADLGPPRDMGYMIYDYSQATNYITLEEAQKSRTIALRSHRLLQLESAANTLDFATFHSDMSWPCVHGLISLEEAQNNKTIARRAVYLL